MIKLGVCWKWVEPEADRPGGISAADEAALEIALRHADTHPGTTVIAVSCGRRGSEEGLRVALAAGADQAVRLDGDPAASSLDVARALSVTLADCDVVLCGDHSLDRGSGSVPAFVAGILARPQALGLIEVDTDDALVWRATRRLDGGRRELLTITAPAVVSVEAPVADLRRASLGAIRSVATATIDIRPGPAPPVDDWDVRVTRFAPRPRVVAPPAGETALERIRSLTHVVDTTPTGETVTAEPGEAAERIIAALHDWGYVTPGG